MKNISKPKLLGIGLGIPPEQEQARFTEQVKLGRGLINGAAKV
jgi:hypothetical protein